MYPNGTAFRKAFPSLDLSPDADLYLFGKLDRKALYL